MPYPVIARGSKLAIHSIEPGETIPLLRQAVAAGVTFGIVKSLNTGVMLDTRKISPKSITVFRYINPHDACQGIELPNFPYTQVVKETIAGIRDRLRTPEEWAAVDYIECFNEADPPGTVGYANMAKLMVFLMNAWEDTLLKPRLMFPAFNAGTPEWNEMLAFAGTGIFTTMQRLGHVLTVHEGTLNGSPIQSGYQDDLPGTPPGQGAALKAGSMALRYRHLRKAMETVGAAVPIFVSEWYDLQARDKGVEALVKEVAWYDAQAAQDPYLLGFAPFTIGAVGSAGGWSWSDYTAAMPALINYMASVKDRQNAVSAQTPSQPVPTPTPTPTPQPSVDFKVGLHARADGHDQSFDFEVFRTARIEAAKLLAIAPPEAISKFRDVRPDMLFLVRLFADFRNRVVTAADFVSWVVPDMQKFYDQGVRLYEVHNEPNLRSEGLGLSWRDGAAFAEWFREVYRLLKAKFPLAQLGFPGLSPGASFEIPGGEQRQSLVPFLNAAQSAVNLADWIGVHVYWQSEADFNQETGGLSYLEYTRRTGKPIYITEFSNSQDRPDLKAAQYVRFYQRLAAIPQIKAAFAFVVSSPSGFENEVWRSEAGKLSPIPQIVGARPPLATTPVPTPVPVPVPVPVEPKPGLHAVKGNWNQRLAPDKTARQQAVILDGTTVLVKEVSPDGKWVKVETVGWVSRDVFK